MAFGNDSVFKVGSMHRFNVKSVRRENGQSFYIIDVKGREYAIRMYPFQVNDEQPETLDCFIKDEHDGDYVIIQDIGPILRRFYKDGNVYEFKVRCNFMPMPGGGYYEIEDRNGFIFRAWCDSKKNLYIKSAVLCRAKVSEKGHVSFMVLDEEKHKTLPFYSPEKFLGLTGVDKIMAKWVCNIVKNDPDFAEAMEQMERSDGEWTITALMQIDGNLLKWVSQSGKHASTIMKICKSSILYVLEQSNFLRMLPEAERAEYQSDLSAVNEKVSELMNAYETIESGKSDLCIEYMLDCLQNSGYLSDAQLRLLTNIFRINKAVMRDKIVSLFDVLLCGRLEEWSLEPFRSAFIEMLGMYISSMTEETAFSLTADTPEGREALSHMLTATTMQMILSKENDTHDIMLTRSRMYRTAAQLLGSDNNCYVPLMEKAFACLCQPNDEKLEYVWNDIKEVDALCLKIGMEAKRHGIAKDKTMMMQTFNGEKAQVRLLNRSLQILPIADKSKYKKTLPEWMVPWHGLQVLLPDTLHTHIAEGSKEMKLYRELWREIENSLFNDGEKKIAPMDAWKKAQMNTKKYAPEVGQEVKIVIIRVDDFDRTILHCRIEDDHYEGVGTMNTRDMVRFAVVPRNEYFYTENGKRALYEAKVKSENKNGTFTFSMLETVGKMSREWNKYGDEKICKIKSEDDHAYIAFSDQGEPVLIKKSGIIGELERDEVVKCTVEDIGKDGRLFCQFEHEVPEEIEENDVFADLMFNLPVGELEENDGEDEDDGDDMNGDNQAADATMSADYVREIIYIIDGISTMDSDTMKTYNYLYYTYLLAVALGDKRMIDYYEERKKFVRLLYQYVQGESVNLDEVEKHEDVLMKFPVLSDHLKQLKLMCWMGKPDMAMEILKMKDSTENEKVRKVCKLVMAYNSLLDFDMAVEKTRIREMINEVLNIRTGQMATYFGVEDEHTEFKTSIVFPPDNNLMPDLQRQTQTILKVICGMMNSKGGRLYLGVNNEGYACGLKNDLAFREFGGSQDKYDLYIRNQVKMSLGLVAGALLDVVRREAGRHIVFEINVRPSSQVVFLNGECYVRQGSSTYKADEKQVNEIKRNMGEERLSLLTFE